MKVPVFLAELRDRDIHVWIDGDRLRCSAPSDGLSPSLRLQLQQYKDEILAFLRASAEVAQQPAIVPLQPHGDRPPVFAVPGHNGDVFCYRRFAQVVGDDQPVFALQPPGLDGHTAPLTRIEDLAQYFADQIVDVHPTSPCIVAGFCTGGTVAFEVAHELRRRGVPVGRVVLFGAPFPTSYRLVPRLRKAAALAIERVRFHLRVIASAPAKAPAYIAERWRENSARRAAARTSVPDPEVVLRTRVENATLAAARRYTPRPFPGRVALLLPSREWVRHSRVGALQWRSMAHDVREVFGPSECDSDNMLREPFASFFADAFRTEVDSGESAPNASA